MTSVSPGWMASARSMPCWVFLPFTVRITLRRRFDPFSVNPPASEMACSHGQSTLVGVRAGSTGSDP